MIGPIVAPAINAGSSGEYQVLEVRSEIAADRRLHEVDFRFNGAGFANHVRAGIYKVDIVPGPTG